MHVFARVIEWQASSRLRSGDQVRTWIDGVRFYVRSGETGLTGNIYVGLHEFEDMGFVLHTMREGDLFVDAGANVGSYTLLASAVARASSVCFEPVPSTFRRLLANLEVNALGACVEARNQGLAAQGGIMRFTSGQDTTNHALHEDEHDAQAVEVEVVTMDDALAGRCPALLKIDVEGFEMQVLRGASRTLANPALNAVIMELNGSGARYGVDEEEILLMMGAWGFSTCIYDPLTRTLSDAQGGRNAEGNTLFVRDLPLARERIAAAPRRRVAGVWL